MTKSLPNNKFWKNKRVFLTCHTSFKGTWLKMWLENLGALVQGYSVDYPSYPNSLYKVIYKKIVPKLLAIAKNRTDTRIYVRGDKTINYGRVLEVMGTLSGAGFPKVALISEPYKN